MVFHRLSPNLSPWFITLQRRWVWKTWLRLVLALVVAAVILLDVLSYPVKAVENARIVKTSRIALAHHWELARWNNSAIVCGFFLSSADLPSQKDIQNNCTKDVYQSWANTSACTAAVQGDASTCPGLFLRYLGTADALVEESVELPPATVTVEHTNCPPWTWCSERPMLAFIGDEPLPGHSIKSVHVRIGEQQRSCDTRICELRMPVTEDLGVMVEYWAVSTYGDESAHQFLPLRNRRPQSQPEQFRLELLGEAWVKDAPPGAVQWGIFPSPGNPLSSLLEQPASPAGLATRRSYLLLAGGLIRSQAIDASTCPSGGLLDNGTANPCGEERARVPMLDWQNRYDEGIFSAAHLYSVPAKLLKAIIARETQFWPVSQTPYELGLGRMTENGADLLMSWNLDYYLRLCINLYGRTHCAAGFSSLSADEKTWLRGKALSVVGTSEELNLLAATFQASSLQVAQMMKNVTLKDVASSATLEDMWALTIANYHGGSGCIGNAMQITADNRLPMTWQEISNHLSGGCKAAIEYVDQVLNLAR